MCIEYENYLIANIDLVVNGSKGVANMNAESE